MYDITIPCEDVEFVETHQQILILFSPFTTDCNAEGNWTEFAGHYYLYRNENVTWFDAKVLLLSIYIYDLLAKRDCHANMDTGKYV